jgi:hypothetical protein
LANSVRIGITWKCHGSICSIGPRSIAGAKWAMIQTCPGMQVATHRRGPYTSFKFRRVRGSLSYLMSSGQQGHKTGVTSYNYVSPKKEGRGWAPRYTLSFHTSINIMAYGYYQQSGMPGWGTNQAILVNRVPLFCLTFSFSFGSELHLLQAFSLNPPVSSG